VLPAFVGSALYVAVRDRVPAGRFVRMMEAAPPVRAMPDAKVVDPFLNVTVPVGGFGPVPVTVAVSVTD
jgi:hypothetical protein